MHHQAYEANCASCHFAYQPGLLPARSWQKIMHSSALIQHFGESAEIDTPTRLAILDYLQSNAADVSEDKWSKRVMRGIKDAETPLRITRLAYFLQRHDEVSEHNVLDNEAVRSWGNCVACHTQAKQGIYDEDWVKIPDVFFWNFD